MSKNQSFMWAAIWPLMLAWSVVKRCLPHCHKYGQWTDWFPVKTPLAIRTLCDTLVIDSPNLYHRKRFCSCEHYEMEIAHLSADSSLTTVLYLK